MKTAKNVLLTLVTVFGCVSAALANTNNNSVLVQAPIDKIFLPIGFDDNDKVEVIVHGHFTNNCYKMGPVDASIDQARKRILVRAEAYYYPGATCIPMTVPFIKSVELDRHVPAGQYRVEVVNRPQAGRPTMNIKVASSLEADEFLYAGVQSASIEETAHGERALVLRGQHPHMLEGCLKLEALKTFVSPSRVIVVQPITKVYEGAACRGDTHSFEYRKKLDVPLKGEYVMHVRVLDGNAINQLIVIE